MRFFVVRHGETNWNVEGRFQGQKDIELNQKGIMQAELLAKRFVGHRFEAIISSPLSRALVTAQKTKDVSICGQLLIDPLLSEINHGDWEGLLADDIKSMWPSDMERWHLAPETVKMPGDGGESLQDVWYRAYRFAEYASLKYKGDVLVASHDAVIKVLLCHWLNTPLSSFWCFQIPNCSITVVEVSAAKKPRLTLLGDATHIYNSFERPEQKGL